MSSNAGAPVVVAIDLGYGLTKHARLARGFENRAGVRTRNDFLKQLAEMGLVVHEVRMRRDHQVGLSTRLSGGLVDNVARSIAALPTSALPAAVAQPVPQTAVDLPTMPAEHSIIAAPRVEHFAAPAAAVAASPVAGKPTTMAFVGDDDRLPPRVAGQGARRLLAGDSGE